MRSPLGIVIVSVVLVFLGAALLKGAAQEVASDPTASVNNGAPRGLLLAYLMAGEKASVRDDDAEPAPGALVVAAPPERAEWTSDEVRAVLAHVERGGRLLVMCDDQEPRNERLRVLLDAVGAGCERADVAIGDEAVTRAVGTMPGFAQKTLYVRGTGRALSLNKSPWAPAWMSASDVVVQKRVLGQGVVTLIGSATLLANDGLAEADNAAFFLDEIPPAGVVFDERHHQARSSFALGPAMTRGTGPITAMIILLLLIPISLLSLAPRPGDPPRGDERRGAPAAEAQARALASLLKQRG